MTTLTFYTTNKGKATELARQVEPFGYTVRQDASGYPEVQADTLREVADAGATWLLTQGAQPPFLLEDSGLFVEGLNGFPGVYSRHALDTIGIDGILRLLRDASSRRAHFASCLLLVEPGGARLPFEGHCDGAIATAPSGAGGFGFDPIFLPDEGDGRTFAAMAGTEKAALSHRGKAVAALLRHLRQTGKP
ncbi:MAG: RdgB/HAM1 family non-canonical purine NTP pyrophosphatase [Candidatus Thermoplasmatota archaeon]